GHFVPNITVGPAVVAALRRATTLPLDVHLMIEAPDRYLAVFAGAGASILTVHVETCPHLHRTIQAIRDLGVRPGVTLNPATSLESVREILPYVEQVLIMTVNPGFGGQSYIPTMTAKIARLAAMLDESGADRPRPDIEVDGGIDRFTAREVVQAGATVLVAGTSVFQHPGGVAAGLRELRAAVTATQGAQPG
ncbi:MAG: ribulose-phosphate 3-epimerase, partial [Anaerolineae bacterium]|nr:ribulose-phosphate 3-epimerase [Anaerolineae bacterium]